MPRSTLFRLFGSGSSVRTFLPCGLVAGAGPVVVMITDRDVPLRGQTGQPPKWFELDDEWESVFPEDRERIQMYVRHLSAERSGQADDEVPLNEGVHRMPKHEGQKPSSKPFTPEKPTPDGDRPNTGGGQHEKPQGK